MTKSELINNKKLCLTGLLIIIIITIFWTGSRYPALDDKASMGGATRLEDPLSFDAILQIQEGDSVTTRVLYSTINWVNTNKQGMIFGVFIAAAILAFLQFLEKKSFERRSSNIIAGFLIGSPMGVCVNCAAPVAKGMHTAGARLETTLTAMFSSPTMNVVVLTMLFSVFPIYLAIIKLVATLVFLFIVLPLLCYFIFPEETEKSKESPPNISPPINFIEIEESWLDAFIIASKQYFKSLWYIVSKTVPLMFLAGFLGALVVTLLPLENLVTTEFTYLGLMMVLLLGTFLPVPIAFDIILSMTLLAAGLPVAYVMALLITLGTYSVYPFMLLWKSISLRVALSLYIAVMATGFFAAVFTDWYENNAIDDMVEFLIEDAGAAELPALANGIQIESQAFAAQRSIGKKSFTRLEGDEIGLKKPNFFNVAEYWPPFYYGRGIASGDVNNDGWEDVLVATERGVLLYTNQQGQQFAQQKIDIPGIDTLSVFITSLVDINNDGWLDVFLTSYRQGNYYLINNKGSFDKNGFRTAPDSLSVLTLGLSFGDIDKDGDLDAAIGNWYYGWPKEVPTEDAKNTLYMNENGTFKEAPLGGITGETLSMLFTDLNQDGHLDLLAANDFAPPDSFFLGTASGKLKEIKKSDDIIPVSTHTTMSFDTADINNDLKYELYIAQIAGKPSEQANRIPSRHIRDYCNDIKNASSKKDCERNIAIRKFYKFGSHSPTSIKQCSTLDTPEDQNQCKAMSVMKTAVMRRRPELCEKIPEQLNRAKFLCENYFKPKAEAPTGAIREAIPQKKNQNVLLQLDNNGTFVDRAEQLGIDIAGWSWNAKFADLDNDQWQDLYVANGILRRGEQPTNFFFHNIKGQTFKEETSHFGLENFMSIPSYTYLDFDHDGDLDIITNTVNGPLWVYINNGNKNKAIQIELKDYKGNRFGIGSQIKIHYGINAQLHQIREIKSGGGYISFDAPITHFGLGKHETISALEIIWSTGETTKIDKPLATNRRYTITRKN